MKNKITKRQIKEKERNHRELSSVFEKDFSTLLEQMGVDPRSMRYIKDKKDDQ